MKRIVINHKFAKKFEGVLQWRNEVNTSVLVLQPVQFKGRDGKLMTYQKGTIFTMNNADIVSDELKTNPSEPLNDADICPDCGSRLNIVTVPRDNGSTVEEATCPGCGYTEA